MKNEIGVVIATYNGEKYIKEQLESIIHQTISPDYIVISDGYSKDKTIDICYNVLSNSKIRFVILKSNRQLSVKDNFEKAFNNCNTKYIFFADQDDKWLPNKIENAMEVFKKYDVDVVFCDAYVTNEKLDGKISLWKNIGYKSKRRINVYNKYDLILQGELIKHNIMTGMCMAVSSRIKEALLPFSNNGIHDIWIAHAVNCLGKVASLNSQDVLYRQHGNNSIGATLSIKKSFNHKNEYLIKLENRLKFINDILQKYSNKYEKIFFDNYLNYQKYLNCRIEYIKKKRNILYFLLLLKKYYKYEYKCARIIIRDLYTRFHYKKDGVYNERTDSCAK